MRSNFRGGTLFLLGVTAFLFSWGCQSTDTQRKPDTTEEPPAPIDSTTSVEPAEDTVVSTAPSEAELRELEEALLEQQKPLPRNSRGLQDQAEKWGAALVRGAEEGFWKLTRGERSLELKEDGRVAVLDGVKLFLDEPVQRKRGNWVLGDSDADLVLENLFARDLPLLASSPIKTIVIDPGHGGTESGTRNDDLGILEKEANLDVSLRLQKRLEDLGYKAILTRYDDRVVDLKERPLIANNLKADLFVSVHFNAALNKAANGIETFVLTPDGIASSSGSEPSSKDEGLAGNRFDRENLALGFCIQKTLIEKLAREDRGLKKARFAVLKSLNCPGVLVECGFVSNQSEALLISTAGYRERVAQALAEAIASFAGGGAKS